MTVYTATPQSPVDGSSSPVPRPTVEATFDTDDGTGGDLQWEWDDSLTFANTAGRYQTLTTLGYVDGELVGVQPPVNMAAGVPYYWRVRAGDNATATWGAWSTPRRITHAPASGEAHLGIWQNVGYSLQHSGEAHIGLWQNIGYNLEHSGETYLGAWQNIGITNEHSGEAHLGVWVGDVDTSVPTPHIWYLIPDNGRPGDGFRIVGMGFGASQAQYNGQAYLGVPLDAAHQLQVVDWGRISPTADAYTSARLITIADIDPQHEYIDVVVYDDAESAAVRVVTDA